MFQYVLDGHPSNGGYVSINSSRKKNRQVIRTIILIHIRQDMLTPRGMTMTHDFTQLVIDLYFKYLLEDTRYLSLSELNWYILTLL